MATPQIGLDKVCFIIVKARELDVQEAVVDEDSGSNPIDDGFTDVLQAGEGDPTREELQSVIDDLNEDEQHELVALAWVGRGDFEPEQWSEAVTEARRRRTAATSRYLLGIPVLADYLDEGLAAFGLSCVGSGPDDEPEPA
ncbi:MAG TPA: DUF3775 domain-containing protein [Geminicoccaceae bacterium]|nr:DUF3775 domain-containing protein [Geminicoccus sp.]HMU51611.1 DUF3775 domain-containing protein [Geminicoccaceae bacterium]